MPRVYPRVCVELAASSTRKAASPSNGAADLDPAVATNIEADVRRNFMAPLLVLIDSKTERELLLLVTRTVSPWLTSPPSPDSMGVKERAAFICKMVCFEQMSDPELMSEFLSIVLHTYTDAQLARREVLDKIEPAFMCGLRSRDSKLRASFFDVFHRSVGQTAAATPISPRHPGVGCSRLHAWLRQALQLLLSTAMRDVPVAAPQGMRLPALRIRAHIDSACTAGAESAAGLWQDALREERAF